MCQNIIVMFLLIEKYTTRDDSPVFETLLNPSLLSSTAFQKHEIYTFFQ